MPSFPSWGESQAEVQFTSSGGQGLPPAGTKMELNGKGTAAGFNASLLYTPLLNGDGKPVAAVGLVYRSQAAVHLRGSLLGDGRVLQSTDVTVVLPQVITGGIALWPVRNRTREWKLELDVDYTGWNSFRNLDVHRSDGTTVLFPQNWRNAFMVMIGTEYKWLRPAGLPDWETSLRAGYLFQQTPVPDRSFSPAFPADANSHGLSIGAGFLCVGGRSIPRRGPLRRRRTQVFLSQGDRVGRRLSSDPL